MFAPLRVATFFQYGNKLCARPCYGTVAAHFGPFEYPFNFVDKAFGVRERDTLPVGF